MVEGDPDPPYLSRILSKDHVADYRFKIVPCPEFAGRSSASAVPLRRFDVGNHAMRIVFDARDPGAWRRASFQAPDGGRLDPLEGSFKSRWATFDIVAAGRPLDADDLEAIVFSTEERRAADVFAVEGPRLLMPERMVAIVARSNGERRGFLAEAFVRTRTADRWFNDKAWIAFRALFTDVGDSGLDCSSHEATPFMTRIALGRVAPIRHISAATCNFSMRWAERSGVIANFSLRSSRPADTLNAVAIPGLFRCSCDVHPRIWGWLLVE
ncbi:MAG TPA: hypothetical protein VFG37_03505 [Planctomycetota bacterium]|nr:hypothetical protein [Planctomycetota bacterium]